MLEELSPDEALAVVGHEYGHLAGSHGHFSAFIYRLRHTWGMVQAYTDQIQGWLGRVVVPLIRWYAPYFNAYTFVLARADEYQADAASARLVGAAQAAHALKRVNVMMPRHQRFMEQTCDRIAQLAAFNAERWRARYAQVAEVYLARRVITVDLSAVQWILGGCLSWSGRRRGKQSEVVNCPARLEWPVPLTIISVDGRFAPWLKVLRELASARVL